MPHQVLDAAGAAAMLPPLWPLAAKRGATPSKCSTSQEGNAF